MRGEFVDVGGARLYYYAAGTRGAGEPVVLLHGFPTSSHLWANVVPHLPAGRRVIVVDLLGFGRSDRPGAHPVDIRAHADRVLALLDQLAIDVACVAGHDIGGAVALAMAVRDPHRVSRLALIAAAAFDEWPTRQVKVARAMAPLTRHLPAPWLQSVLRTDLLRGYASPEHGAHSVGKYIRPFADSDGRDAFFRHLSELDPRDTMAMAPRLAALAQPTAIVWGRQDPFLPVRLAARLEAAIPGGMLEVLDDARHFLPEEQPQQVAAAITSLLQR